ncbi:MAG: penicillin-binding protein 2 [Actinomycetota bacterium]|nr:penicillin-binding protein 2 [Actinomycetota bacterium]
MFPGKGKSKERKPTDRFPFLFSLFIVVLLVIGGRLVFIQAVQADKLDRLARAQRFRQLELSPERGTIYDRKSEILAISVDMDTVYATPYQVKAPRRSARLLAAALGENRNDIYKKLIAKSGFSYIKRKVDKAAADRVKKLKLKGIGLAPESKRFYPGKSIASQAIGFVGLDNNGLAGIELSYDTYLKGSPGRLTMEQDPGGRPIPGGQFKLRPATNGRNLVLTIDKEIQYKAQVELKKAVKKSEARGGWMIVMDSKTGEIYAMANEPTFDLNKFYKAKPELFTNRALSDVYEPGSTMKIVTAAAALEERLYSPSTAFNLPGTINIGGYTIHEAHPRGTEMFTFSQIVSRSSNIGAVTIGMALGKDRLYDYTTGRFSLNTKTGIELPGEGQGCVPPPDKWSASTIGNVPFGQGLSATALEMIRTVNVVAAGGRLIQPRIVKEIIDSNGRSLAIKRPKDQGKQVISKATAATKATILKEAVETGTGQSAKIPGYEVAGKTGTAQKPKVDARGYDPGKYIATFTGFTPVRDPALTILIAIDEPKGAIYGGVIAAPLFSAVGEYALQRLKIEP